MSIDSERRVSLGDLETDLDVEHPGDVNTVSIVFADGDIEQFSLVVRRDGADWVYAERCVAVEEEFVEERVVSVNAADVRQIESDRIHLFEDGVLHCGDAYLVDPATVLEESWFDSDDCVAP